jgi:protein TonB
MNERNMALSVSLALHGSVLFLVYTLNSSFVPQPRPILVDLSLEDREASPAKNVPLSAPARPAAALSQPAQHRSPQMPSQIPVREPAKQILPATVLAPAGPVPGGSKPALVHQAVSDRTTVVTAEQSVRVDSQAKSGDSSLKPAGEPSHEQLQGKYRSEHFAYIKKIIQENITYPAQAKRMQWSGTCQLSFVVLESGQVTDIRILKSTGHSLLDDNVAETIRRVAPFTRPPVSVRLIIPFTYNIF